MNTLASLSLALMAFGLLVAAAWPVVYAPGPAAVAADWPSADLQPIPMEKPL